MQHKKAPWPWHWVENLGLTYDDPLVQNVTSPDDVILYKCDFCDGYASFNEIELGFWGGARRIPVHKPDCQYYFLKALKDAE